MRTLLLGAALLVAAPAFACPMEDAAVFSDAAAKVEASTGTKLTLSVDGMHCSECAGKVTAALNGLPGIVASAVDYQTGRTEISYDASKVKIDAMLKAIEKVGFTAHVAPAIYPS